MFILSRNEDRVDFEPILPQSLKQFVRLPGVDTEDNLSMIDRQMGDIDVKFGNDPGQFGQDARPVFLDQDRDPVRVPFHVELFASRTNNSQGRYPHILGFHSFFERRQHPS